MERFLGGAMRRWWMLGAGTPAVLAGMLVIGLGIGDRWAEPEQTDEWARFAEATAVQGLAIVVDREPERLVPGRATTYTIAVGNRDSAPQPVMVQASVPPWLTVPDLPEGAEPAAGAIDWPLRLAPGDVTTVRLTAVYREPGPDTPERVAFTACVRAPTDGRPIVCATDIGKLESTGPALIWWVAGGAALAGLAGPALVRWRRRVRAPKRSRLVG